MRELKIFLISYFFVGYLSHLHDSEQIKLKYMVLWSLIQNTTSLIYYNEPEINYFK